MKKPLSRSQREVYDFVKTFEEKCQRLPTVREIGAGKVLGEQITKARTSPASVHRLVVTLEEKGWMEVQRHQGEVYRKPI
jgi:SOS-response transcriptional repressor LexA